jgi:hypothetical protein
MRSLVVRMSVPLALALWAAIAVAGGPRALPSLALSDPAGAAVTEATLAQSVPWVLLVVDADKHLTTTVLPRFQKKDGDWAGKLVVVAAGSPAAFERMVAQNAKLAGVRWTRDTSGRLLEQLDLSGTPVLLGIRAGNVIAWQIASVPEAPEKAQALVANWIAKAVPEHPGQ